MFSGVVSAETAGGGRASRRAVDADGLRLGRSLALHNAAPPLHPFRSPFCGFRPSLPGFTLLEVLVALAIFAMAAVVLGATYVNALNAYQAAGRRNEYDADLRFVRAALLTEPDREKAEEGGDLDLGGSKRAHWQADIASTDTVDLFSVVWTCEIVDPERPKPYRTTQTFLLLRPTWSDPVERTALLDQVKQRILELQKVAP
jgi:general secretion pathway protein I